MATYGNGKESQTVDGEDGRPRGLKGPRRRVTPPSPPPLRRSASRRIRLWKVTYVPGRVKVDGRFTRLHREWERLFPNAVPSTLAVLLPQRKEERIRLRREIEGLLESHPIGLAVTAHQNVVVTNVPW
jgi:hypothetical protein